MALRSRVPFGLAVCLAALLSSESAFCQTAPADEDACAAAFSEGPALTKSGRLVLAREALSRCSVAPCPASMRRLCAADVRSLDDRIPTVVFIAKGERGEDLLDVRVTEKGRAIVDRLDGRSIPLDPGPHAFRFELASGRSAEVAAVLHEGERARDIQVALSGAPSPAGASPVLTPVPAAPATSRPLPWTVFVAGGLTVAAGATFGVFGIRGLVLRSELSGCKGTCSPESVARINTSYDVANASLIVAAGALALTAVLYFTRPARPAVVAGPDGLLVTSF
jgi:hypothetical protein